MSKVSMTTLQQILYVANNSQGKQELECQITSLNHAMNPNGKGCIVCTNLLSTNFCALECTYPINPKTKELLSYRSITQTPSLLQWFHDNSS
jgi:predicted DNA-binding helix-hairpin-helix protein